MVVLIVPPALINVIIGMLLVVIPVIEIAFVPETRVALPTPSTTNETRLPKVVPLPIVKVAEVAGGVINTLFSLVEVATPKLGVVNDGEIKGAYIPEIVGVDDRSVYFPDNAACGRAKLATLLYPALST